MTDIGNYLESQFSLAGKTALLTGGAGGIGKALALGLCGAGARVAICDINTDRATQIAQELTAKNKKAKAFKLDLTNMDSIRQCVDAVAADFGKIDILINCA